LDGWTAFWTWAATPLGSTILGGLFVAAVTGVIVWARKPIARFLRQVRDGYQARMRRKYGPSGPEPVRTTISVDLHGVAANPSQYGQFVELYSNRVGGGPMKFTLANHGPFDANDVAIELVTPSIHAQTPLYWEQMPASPETYPFQVEVPFGAERQAVLRWRQGEHTFTRNIELPTGRIPHERA